MTDSHRPATNAATADTQFLCTLLSDLRIEVLPNVDLDKVIEAVPKHATLAVTSSPQRGVEGTLHTAIALRRAGYRVVPHLAARAIRDRAQLADLWRQYSAEGVDEVFIVGGDQEQPAGEFAASLDLVKAVVELDPRPHRIGITSYPEGHPHIPADVLERDLLAKQPCAQYAVTNLVFDPEVFVRWLSTMRARGFTLPIYIGLPGTLRLDRLIRIGMRLGLGSSLRYLEKQRGLVGRLLTGGGLRYDPGDFLDEVARQPAEARTGIIGVHWYSFNAVSSVVTWVSERQQRLGC
ncbi:methylenetetrahydrofolate reductase [Thermomicrobium sp. 4228-Ro]|uniref:methylenetetrahydrofolate reductase n=1 Tax=Thermomicrobium sp. 4228-Ro TaxID=2993937 RepID=UPI0022493E16|nr:methylenetetrahydrofolate reductase [Thermomicrobium sp. 4228-Ro]MCX2725969.1 methylenetetrahydrofolate reductase [Thermomicrobium sp. 4228-Ro]